MSDSYSDDKLPSLTIKDKMNYPWLIANQVLTYQKMVQDIKFSEDMLREVAIGFCDLVVDSIKDEQWETDLEDAIFVRVIDVRPEYCGTVIAVDYCKRKGIPIYKKELDYDYHKLIRACMNLFDRRGYLTKKARVEKMLGEKFVKHKKDS